ncbi:MAG TPA: hypothetical protein VGH24_09605 [Solirubrobacteraceae bacterium]|jgi:hypothetical protein
MQGIQASFGTVLWIVTGVSFVAGFFALLSSGKQWEDYGRGHLVMDRDSPPPAGGDVASPAAIRERDEEIREFLEARNARRHRRGEAPLDVEAELRRLTVPVIDAGLREEIRDLVIARNHRRVRAGKPRLDVSAEIDREISKLESI